MIQVVIEMEEAGGTLQIRSSAPPPIVFAVVTAAYHEMLSSKIRADIKNESLIHEASPGPRAGHGRRQADYPMSEPAAVIAFACPRCGYQVEAATAIRDAALTPHVGDLSVCLWCAAPLEFRADGPPRWLSLVELGRVEPPARRDLISAIVLICTRRPSRVRYQR